MHIHVYMYVMYSAMSDKGALQAHKLQPIGGEDLEPDPLVVVEQLV